MNTFNTYHTAQTLTQIGLSEREAVIYLAALETGGGSLSELAEAGQIERTGIYYHINHLLELELLRTASKGRRTVYLPADPERLKEIFLKKQTAFNQALPLLQERFAKERNKAVLEYYQGREEVNAFYDKIYQLLGTLTPPNNTVYVLGQSFQAVSSKHPDFLNYTRPEQQLQIITKAILAKSQKLPGTAENTIDPYIVSRYNLPPAELRYIEDKYTYPSAVIIMGDYVAVVDFENFFYTITNNANNANTWRFFFEFIWGSLAGNKIR